MSNEYFKLMGDWPEEIRKDRNGNQFDADVLQDALNRVADLKQQLAAMKQRRFPIMDGPDVPWEVMVPHESMCQRNHGQRLEELARRGGLDCGEAWCVVSGIRLTGLEQKPDWDNFTRSWFEFAERINTHYERIADLKQQLAEVREQYQQHVAMVARKERPAYDEQQKRIADLERQISRRTQQLEELGNHREWPIAKSGLPCACRFDENDNYTAKCALHSALERQVAELCKAIEKKDELFSEVNHKYGLALDRAARVEHQLEAQRKSEVLKLEALHNTIQRLREQLAEYNSREVVGWLRGTQFIDLPENRQDGDVPVFVIGKPPPEGGEK